MQIVTLYLITAVVFLALDIVMLKRVLYPLFSSNLGDWLLEDPRTVSYTHLTLPTKA